MHMINNFNNSIIIWFALKLYYIFVLLSYHNFYNIANIYNYNNINYYD